MSATFRVTLSACVVHVGLEEGKKEKASLLEMTLLLLLSAVKVTPARDRVTRKDDGDEKAPDSLHR